MRTNIASVVVSEIGADPGCNLEVEAGAARRTLARFQRGDGTRPALAAELTTGSPSRGGRGCPS
jgi:hypothetical protein